MNTNFLSKESELLEEMAAINFSHFLVPADDVLDVAKTTIPDRIRKIKSKAVLCDNDLDILDQIGADFLIEFMGVRFAIDVTTGSSTVVKNKKAKMKQIKPFLDKIQATPVVLCCRAGSTSKSMIEEIIRSPVCQKTGVIDCRIT